MHTFGFVSYIEEIISVCDEFNIPVVEDAAESLGSYSGMQHTGTFGKLGTLSLNGNKVVTSGGGGAIMTDDEELAKLAKHLTTTAKVPHKWDYVHNYTAYNYRMPNLNAALACAQLESLDRYLANKRDLVGEYANAFGSEVEILKEREGTTANYWLITLRFDSEKEKLAFLAFSNEKGVMTRPAWKLMNELDMYKNCPKSDLSMAQQQANLIVNIPSSVRV